MRLLPLIEVIDRDEAAPTLERLAERRPRLDALGLGVDVGEADLDVLRPERDEPPIRGKANATAHRLQMASRALTGDPASLVAKLRRSGQRAEGQTENTDGASSKLMITEAERRFPCRIKPGVPTGGLGPRLHAWLDENCGADGWAMTPAGLRGVVNDAVAIYFLEVTAVAALVARWCAGSAVEISDGAFRVREQQSARRITAAHTRLFEDREGVWVHRS